MASDSSTVPTFHYDSTLPSLPVPEVDKTFSRLRAWVDVTKQNKDEMKQYDDLVAEAIPQLAAAQQVLLERQKAQPNYIGEWWTQFAYLRNRFPNVINTNVFSVRDSDFDALGSPNPLSLDPVVRAALVAYESLSFRNLVMRQQLPVERMAGKAPMCMNQYKYYWTTRVPGREVDSIYSADPWKTSRIGIMHRGALFFINTAFGGTPTGDGMNDLNVAELIEVIRLGISKIRPPPLEECVGILTAGDRDVWAAAHSELASLSDNNRKILNHLYDTITVISIDDEPVTSLKEGVMRASHQHPHNRWYDRSSLRIVASNGVCLEHGDHTAMDAIVMASTPVDLMSKLSRDFVQDGQLAACRVRNGFIAARHVENVAWDLSSNLRATIKEVHAAHLKNAEGIELDCFTYLGFGREALRQAKIPADAFVQQVLQLAFFRDRGHVVPVYETASTRMFKEGRTDTIRSLTKEQQLLVTSFDDPAVPTAEKASRLKKAMAKHVEITNLSSTGKGVDRHLLALRIAQQVVLGQPLPKIFELPAVQRAGEYQLLTSQMIGRYFVGGFAHVLDDGYGCCYYLRRNAVCIVVAGCSKAGLTNVDRFQKHLTKAFHDLAQVALSLASDTSAPHKASSQKKNAKL